MAQQIPVSEHIEVGEPLADGTIRSSTPTSTARARLPAADPSIADWLMSLLSPLYPRGPIGLGSRLRPLPADGSVPDMAGWRWIHTPAHTPGTSRSGTRTPAR
jgi:hypothetical protein